MSSFMVQFLLRLVSRKALKSLMVTSLPLLTSSKPLPNCMLCMYPSLLKSHVTLTSRLPIWSSFLGLSEMLLLGYNPHFCPQIIVNF